MFYRRNFKKYHAFTMQSRELPAEGRIVDLKVTTADLEIEFRLRFPEFFSRSTTK